jgi:predicted dehydrogenase
MGSWGRAHSDAFHQVGCFFDLAIAAESHLRPRRSEVEAFASRWGWEETQTDWQSVVTRNDVDVVDVCTPNHLSPSRPPSLGKIVLCEKPLAMHVAKAKPMADAARSVPNLVWFNYRGLPAIAFAKGDRCDRAVTEAP